MVLKATMPAQPNMITATTAMIHGAVLLWSQGETYDYSTCASLIIHVQFEPAQQRQQGVAVRAAHGCRRDDWQHAAVGPLGEEALPSHRPGCWDWLAQTVGQGGLPLFVAEQEALELERMFFL